MDRAEQALVAALHASPFRIVLAFFGSTAASDRLLALLGASQSILECTIILSEQALAEYIGRRPASSCSIDTVKAMAQRALTRARWLAPGAPVVGIACTASQRSDNAVVDRHQFHIARASSRGIAIDSVAISAQIREKEEEPVLAKAMLNVTAEALGIAVRLPAGLRAGEEFVHATDDSGFMEEFLSGRRSHLCVQPDGKLTGEAALPRLLLPGSFNPLHHGHVALAAVASQAIGSEAAFEIAIQNADKPALDDHEVRRRMAFFAWKAPLWLTRAPTFAAKARLFPEAVFVVGADTAARIVDVRFYGGNEGNRDAELSIFRSRGCRFLVAGRVDGRGKFLELDHLSIPDHLRDLFSAIPLQRFRRDVSSTELRFVANNNS